MTQETDVDSVSLDEAVEFFADRSATEAENFSEGEGTDIPNHGEALVADSATDLLKAVTSMEMAVEMSDEDEDIPTDEMEAEVAESLVDVFSTLAIVQYERDIDIAEAIEGRMEFIRDYEAFEEAMKGAETEEEKMDVMDEHLTDELAEELGMGVAEKPDIGANVDAEGYEADQPDRHVH